MKALSPARAAGILILAVGVASSGFAQAAGQPGNDKVAEMAATIFAGVPPSDSMTIVFKDAPRREYLAFYMATYGDVRELRAYKITFRNASEYIDDLGTVDALLADGNFAEAFDGLVGVMRLDMGSQYVSDVALDGVHDGDVPVGSGHLSDGFHPQVFATHADAEAAYMQWLERAVGFVGG